MAYSSKTKKMAFVMPAAKIKIDKILALLKEKPMNLQQLCDSVHAVPRTMRIYMNYLHDTKQIYYTCYKYEKVGEKVLSVRYYKAGNHKDAKKPPALTGKQRCKLKRDRLNEDPEKKEFYLARRRALRWAKKHQVTPNEANNWLKKGASNDGKVLGVG